MNFQKTIAVFLVAALVGSVLAPTALAASDGQLSIDVSQAPKTGDATVAVTENEAAVANATVNVTTNGSYEGVGTYTTDTNGTVALPNPNETVEVAITAATDGDEANVTTELVPRAESLAVGVEQASSGNATATVTQYDRAVENATVNVTSETAYAGNGTYETDANGTVDLPAPEETSNVTVTTTVSNLSASATTTLTGALNLSVSQADDRTATVTLTRNGFAVENAMVNVTSETAYAGNGTYKTDANGTVDLPAPNETVTVTVSATDSDVSTSTTGTLLAADDLWVSVSQSAEGDVTVSVTRNETGVENATVTVTSETAYAGNGTYKTDANGTVDLSAPEENLTIAVTATHDNDTAMAQADLLVAGEQEPKNFGQMVSDFVKRLQGQETDGPRGIQVAHFVTENNPGQGPPSGEDLPPGLAKKQANGDTEESSDADTASEDDADETNDESTEGNEDDAADESDDRERGPPEHANDDKREDAQDVSGNDSDESDDDTEDDDSDESDDDTEDDDSDESDDDTEDDAPGRSGSNGNPPSHAAANGN